jgi:hypothetical protein
MLLLPMLRLLLKLLAAIGGRCYWLLLIAAGQGCF